MAGSNPVLQSLVRGDPWNASLGPLRSPAAVCPLLQLGAVVLFLSYYSLVQRDAVPTREGFTSDPDTGVSFSNAIKVDGTWLNLLGTGVRVKVVVNVYSAALYADSNALKRDLGGFVGKTADALAATLKVGEAITASTATKGIILHFVRGVDAGKVADALSDVPGASEKAKAELGACIVANGPISSGDQLLLAFKGKDALSVRTKQTVLCTLKDSMLAKGVLSMYVGGKPVSPKLKASMASGLEQLLVPTSPTRPMKKKA